MMKQVNAESAEDRKETTDDSRAHYARVVRFFATSALMFDLRGAFGVRIKST